MLLDITKPIIDNEESLLMRANKMQKRLKKRPHFKAEDDTLLVSLILVLSTIVIKSHCRLQFVR